MISVHVDLVRVCSHEEHAYRAQESRVYRGFYYLADKI